MAHTLLAVITSAVVASIAAIPLIQNGRQATTASVSESPPYPNTLVEAARNRPWVEQRIARAQKAGDVPASSLTDWLQWHDALRTPGRQHRVLVTVDSLRVDEQSRWDGRLYYPDVSLTLTMTGGELRTGEVELDVGKPAAPSGCRQKWMDWTWGAPIEVAFSCSDYSNETLSTCVPDLVALIANDGVVTTDGGRIRATLSFAGEFLQPPALP